MLLREKISKLMSVVVERGGSSWLCRQPFDFQNKLRQNTQGQILAESS